MGPLAREQERQFSEDRLEFAGEVSKLPEAVRGLTAGADPQDRAYDSAAEPCHGRRKTKCQAPVSASLFGQAGEYRRGRFPEQRPVFAGKPSELPEAVPRGDFCHRGRGWALS